MTPDTAGVILTSDQFRQVMDFLKELSPVLKQLAQPDYMLTSAKDWPIFIILMGAIVALIGMMWRDLKNKISEDKVDRELALSRIVVDYKEKIAQLKDDMDWCQENCCELNPHRRRTDRKKAKQEVNDDTSS